MMGGFPNFFMTTGPNGPAALANIIRISENDVDWIAALIEHMAARGLRSVEPRAEAEAGWMDIVTKLARRTLLSKAKTWYLGATVKEKTLGLTTMFTGGFPTYREHCLAVIQNG